MLRIYLDADTSEALAKVLRAEGFEVVRAHDVGLDEEDDIAQIRWASEHGYVLFTFDAKTMPKAIDEWQAMGNERSGVIICEQMPKDAVSVIVRRLKNVAQVHTNETLRNVTLHLGAVWDKPVKEGDEDG
jgi:predicted nuclease of predicted toxin-antitoxin system